MPANASASATERPAGLSAAEAAARLRADGPNLLPTGDRRTRARIAIETVREPMFLLLLAATAAYFALGEAADGVTLLCFVVVSVVITFVQENRSERALAALAALTSPRARVLRDGRWESVDGAQVVVGDLLRIVEGDRAPADALLIEAEGLTVDESLLTGESAPVRKEAPPLAGERPDARSMPKPGGEDSPAVFAGTLIAQGHGLARVTATGSRSAIGGLGASLAGLERAASPLRAQTARLVRAIAAAGLVLGGVVAVVQGLSGAGWLAGLLSGIALMMALLPEEYGVVLAVFPALGARRLAAAGVLTRRIAALETLGATTVLCVDKTGTLTENRMRVAYLWNGEDAHDATRPGAPDAPPSLRRLAHVAAAASEIDPFDPMERAFRAFAGATPAAPDPVPALRAIIHEYPLTAALRAMSHVWSIAETDERFVATKGAPEAVLKLCRASPERTATTLAEADRLAARGWRVLAAAEARLPAGPLPAACEELPLRFLGLIALVDPLRPEAAEAVRRAKVAGVRVMMITGDYPATAAAIAAEAGLPAGPPLTGDEVRTLADDALRTRLMTAHVCARVAPEQKLRIVRALQAAGHVVAMTGDGVNDAPALKAAHAGVAMGGRGSEVAREAAAIVLLRDDFAALVAAIAEGRRIFANMRRSLSYVFAVHVPIAGMALLPAFSGAPFVLLPAHMALLEFVIDPACALVFEAEPPDADAMRRPPRDVRAPLLGRVEILRAARFGFAAFLAAAIVDAVARRSLPEEAARAATFIAVVAANLALILVFRVPRTPPADAPRSATPVLRRIFACVLLGLAATLYVPFLSDRLRFSPPPLAAAALSFAFGLAAPFVAAAFERRVRADSGGRGVGV